MPVIDVSVIKAFNVVGYPIKKSFCVYVRLQGQAMRTDTRAGKHGEVDFHERFRFQYRPDRNKGREKNQLFVELWCKSMLSQSCVSVAWIDMDAQAFVQGTPITFNMHGGFESKQATVTVVIVPVDFSTVQRPPPPPPLQQQQQQQQQMPPYAPYAPYAQPAYYAEGQPAVGVPLESSTPFPYPTAAYTQPQQKTAPMGGGYGGVENPSCGEGGEGCEPAPLPPAAAFADTTLPPPLYGGGGSSSQSPQPSQSPQCPPPYEPPAKTL